MYPPMALKRLYEARNGLKLNLMNYIVYEPRGEGNIFTKEAS